MSPRMIGPLAYALLPLLLIFRRPTAAGAFAQAKATSPETARRPLSLGFDLHEVRDDVRNGLLIPLGDGRFYVDLPRYRARQRRITIAAAAVLVALAVALLAFELKSWGMI